MEEIKIGEYVRTPYNTIEKIIKVEENKTYIGVETDRSYYSFSWLKAHIVKHSSNIIDLIEIGDYVNGYKVIDIKGGYLYIDKINLDTELYETLVDYQVFSVVTKEQFANAEYRLEEYNE